jgi:hypothetical protein
VCLSEIKSGHIRDAIRRGPGGEEYALPSFTVRDRGASLSKAKCVRVRQQNVAQMAFAKYHDMVSAFPADRADQPFRIGVLPG